MLETPLQFQHHGEVAGLRPAPLPVVSPWVVEAGVPAKRRRSPWVWLGVGGMAAAATLWWFFPENPVVYEEATVPGVEISPTIEVPKTAPSGTAVPTPEIVVAPPPAVHGTTEPSVRRAARTKPGGGSLPAASIPVVPQISLVRTGDATPEQAGAIRRAVHGIQGALRTCSAPLMQRDRTLKGTLRVQYTVREGRISALTVGSPIRDPSLRWCFRKSLMGLSIAGTTPTFEGSLEFFVVPRTTGG